MGKAVERKEGKKRRPALSDLRKRTLKGKQQKLTSNSAPHSNGKKGRYWLKKGMMNKEDEEDEEAEEAEDLRYMEQFYKTDGFDMYPIVPTPGYRACGGDIISPLSLTNRAGKEYQICAIMSQFAIDEHHRRKQRRTFFKPQTPPPLKFVKVLKAMSHHCDLIRYYITFQAKDVADGGKTKVYRTLVRLRRLPFDNRYLSVLSMREYKKEEEEKGDQVIHICTAIELETQLNAASTTSCLAILYFSETDSCRYMSLLYTSLARKHPKVVFLKVDIDEGGPEARGMAAGWNVSRFPTFFFFKSGKEVDKFDGVDEPALKRKLAQHSRKQARRRRKRVV